VTAVMDVVRAVYADAGAAGQDFDALCAQVQGKTVESDGVIRVERGAHGQVRVDRAPCPFTGTVKKVTFDLHTASHEDGNARHEHAAVQALGRGAAG
jgi:hypothetical protein